MTTLPLPSRVDPVSSPPLPAAARVLDLGVREYGAALELQRELVQARQRDEIPDTLVLVEHPHVITLGRGTHRENILAPGDVPIFEIERGGDVTYHGPGQLVGYPILALRDGERDLHRYLRNLEEAMIATVGELGVPAGRRAAATGVWTVAPPARRDAGGSAAAVPSREVWNPPRVPDQRKLASIGIAVKRWVTLHGFALNVATDLARFGALNPCGFEAGIMTSVSAELGRPVGLPEVKRPLVRHLGAILNRTFAG